MEKRKRKLQNNKVLKKINVSMEAPIAMDISTDITRLFQVNAQKKKRISEYMCESIRKTKKNAEAKLQLNCPLPVLRPTTKEEFVEFSIKCPYADMPRQLERSIKKMIKAKDLEETHPEILSEIIKEAKEEYAKVLHRAAINQKIKNSYPEVKFTIQPYKYLGKTDRYKEYLSTRKRLNVKWILHHPVVRKVFKECVIKIPNELCHLTFDEIFLLDDIKHTLKDKAQSAFQFVYEFYSKILSLVNEKHLKSPGKSSHSYLLACTGILSIHISRTIARTILYVVKFTETNQPYISLNVSFDKGLVVTPTAEEIVDMYHNFIDKIIDSGREIYVLQRMEIKGYEKKYMPLCLTEEFINSSKSKISDNIERIYKPITLYLQNISRDLKQIYPDINSKDFIESISDITFDVGCERITYYKKYLHRVAYIPDHEYFEMGQMILVKYRTDLHDGLQQNIDLIFEKLCSQHLWEVTDLCETFKMINTRAYQNPLTTEELIETGKYMNWIKSEHLDVITTRVEDSLTSLCQIIDLGFLTEDHMELNSYVINWLEKVSPVVEEHLVAFEQLKFDAEEKLQKAVEDVNCAIKAVDPLLVILDDMDEINRIGAYIHSINLHTIKIKEVEEQISWINKEEVCLSFPKSTYAEYDNLKNYVYPFYHLLKLCQNVQRNVFVWQDGPFENLSYDVIKSSTEEFYKELTEVHKIYRKQLRQAQDENLPVRFKGTIDDPDILNWPAPLKLCGKAMKLIDDFKPSVNVTKIICNKSLRRRHWKVMSEIAGTDITPNAGTTLRKMMKIDFYANLDEYEIISAGATKEKQLIDNLRALELLWEDIEFTVTKYKNTKILSLLDEIEAIINDHNIKVLNMKASVFVKPHEKQVSSFHNKILRISKTIDIWNKVQAQWILLLPIFSTNHMSNDIPKESELFNNVIVVYNDYIEKISAKPNVMKLVETTDILENMDVCLTDIEVVHRGVVAYLEILRQIFPRLYFISEDELLCTLAEVEPLKSQTFLTKIFPGIYQLISSESEITGMESYFGEEVNFIDTLDMVNNKKLEELCHKIEQQMIVSLNHYLTECYKIFRRNNVQEMLHKFPQQVIHVVSQVYWTEHLKSALCLTHNIKLRIYYQKLDYTVKNKIRILSDTNVTNLEKLKLRNLIIEDLNLRYLCKKILESSYISENQLDWEAHPKYYIDNGQVIIQLLDTKTSYMYEYLGNSSPIILTPLTDRCYRTLINAQQMHFCGMLQGSGDSGKSDTIRALAAIFGGLVISFNCLPKLNPKVLVKLITGTILCRSWLCLKNFDMLEPNVLSVVSQNIFTVLSAAKSGLKQCFLGDVLVQIKTKWFLAASIKTNSNKEIPDNLRVLFRTTTLISPDVEQIVETMCYSIGLQNAKTLSKKIICIYNSFKNLLLSQTYYYFGISTLKKMFYQYDHLKQLYSTEGEETLIFNSIRTLLIPTISSEDMNIFDEVMKKVFPNAEVFIDIRTNLEEYIFKYFEDNNLQLTTELPRKIIETYDCLNAGTGVIILGETFTGKTTVLNTCEYISTKLENRPLIRNVINPNSLDYDDLYGKFDKASLHWSDGIISKTIRNFSTIDDGSRKWLILDGNIDASWIENITNTLKNNDKFYLESGETLNLNSTTIIFEVKNLDAASPSTISRCGLVYMPSSLLTWKEFVKSWIKSCKSEWIEEYRELVRDLLNWLIPPCLNFITTNCQKLCDLSDINLVKNMIHLTHMILDESYLSILRKEEDVKNLPSWIQATLISAGITGLGSTIHKSSMQKFDEFYKLLWKGQNNENPYPNSFDKLEVIIPHEGLLCDYQYLYKQRGIWKLYQDFLKNEKIVENPYMIDFVVPTSDILKLNIILTMLINRGYPTLLIGPTGTGKSVIIENILINKIDKDKYETSHLNFNCNTTSKQIQKYLISKLNKRKNGRYSPPQNKNFLIFIDNLNLVTINQHNSSSVLELFRQHLGHGVWYDLKNYNPIYLENINTISVMSTTEMKEKTLCKRFLRYFSVFSMDNCSEDTLSRIYSNMLIHIWKKSGFPSDINIIISQIVTGTIRIYYSILKRCKPTLNKCYYLFSLSDFTKVIKGCSNLKKETYDSNKKIYLNLWSHEVQRVFGDRLNHFETNRLLQDIKIILKEEFNGENEEMENKSSNNETFKLIFGTFNDRHLPVKERRYEEVGDMHNLQNTITESLKTYNSSHRIQLDLILFAYTLEKLVKICRIMSISPGNALLLGKIGCGRQSLTKLGAHLYNQYMFQPTMITNYSINEWNIDVKLILKEAGGLEKQCVFLVNEEQLIDEQFLENLDFLLRNGEIPNLYDAEEKQEILELARLSAQGGNRNLDISSSDVFLYFNKKCKENLHLILCHSINKSLRNRIRRHPSLTNMHVILFEDWPEESLEYIARTWTKELNLTEDIKHKITEASIYFHRQSENFAQQIVKSSKFRLHITSKAFIHLIKLFTKLMTTKQNDITSARNRFKQGLAKLSHAANQIVNMQKSLAEYQPQLEEMTEKAIVMTEQIALETIQVEKASALVRKDEKIAGEQAAVAQVLKSECEAELAQAIPILEDAISALNTLKPSDITLVKSMKNPPDAIKLVMAAVCVIKDVKPERLPDPSTGRKTIDYWGPSKRILGDMNFLQTLKDFDKDHIKPEIMVKIRKEYLPHKDFKPHIVAKASSAAEGLCKWIIAMDMYDKVAKEVAPKKEKLGKAEREYAQTMAVLNEKKEELTRLEKKLAELNELLADAIQKQIKLQKEVDYCNKKLSSAQKLIGNLSEERSRWTVAAKNLETQYDVLPGNILIFSGVTAYLAPISEESRNQVINIWHDYIKEKLLPCSEHYDITDLLSSDKEIDFWLRNKIPDDGFFLQNAIIRKYSENYSIFIDPHYRAKNWIERIERKNKITLSTFTEKDCLDRLKNIISHGKPILIHQIKDTIPLSLIELLQKQIFCRDEDKFIKINNEDVKVDENFRLYLVCNLNNPCFSPEMYNRVTLINFKITEKSLEKSLLKTVTEIEKPELKNLKKDITLSNKRDKAALLKLEKKILNTLCKSEMDILEDEVSIRILDESKNQAKSISVNWKETKHNEAIIDDFKNGYKDVARYSANLFSCVNELKNINYIYEFSLDWYMEQYFRSVLNARASKDINERCKNIRKHFTYQLYTSLKNSLFKHDMVVFLFLLTTRILLFDEKINKKDIDSFLKSTWTDRKENVQWTDEYISRCLEQIEGIHHYLGFFESLRNDSDCWKNLLQRPNLDLEDFRATKLNNLQKLLLLKLLRPDQLFHNIKRFIFLELGNEFLNTFYFELSETYNDSYSLSPIIIFLYPGINVTQKLLDLARKKQTINSFKILSVSLDHVATIDNFIEASQKCGSWILIQNCHLLQNRMQWLQEKLVQMDVDNTHENFRLWLTTKPTDEIPIELLQNSIKVVIEDSEGLRNKLYEIYKTEPVVKANFYSGCLEKSRHFTRLLYALSLFNCILKEKRKFGIVSSRAPYIFSDDDLNISQLQLQLAVNQKTFNLKYLEKLAYSIGNCNYAGNTENKWDIQLVTTLLKDCFDTTVDQKGIFNNLLSYGLPRKNDHKDYLLLISKLPNTDDPRLFGLNETIVKFASINDSKELIASVLSVLEHQGQPDLGQQEFDLLICIDDILKKLPKPFCMETKSLKNVGIEIEIKQYRILINAITNSLVNLKKAFGGDSKITIENEDAARNILKNKVPSDWLRFSYPHQMNLSLYVENLCQRIIFFKNTLKNPDKTTFWLAAFFFPRSFICQIKIDFSSKTKMPLEEIIFDHEVLDKESRKECSGTVFDGLFIKGARWDKDKSQLSEVKNLYDSFPPILFKPISIENYLEDQRCICPVYQIDNTLDEGKCLPGSKNFIHAVLLPTDLDQGHWIKRGIKIVCQAPTDNSFV